MSLYVEILIRAPIDALWAHTQTLRAISVAMASSVVMAIPIIIVIIPGIGYLHHVGAQREGLLQK
jgi:hypothetical protein